MVYGDRLMRILAEEALCRLPNVQTGTVETPCGHARGLLDKWKLDICLVSVVRSGKGTSTYHSGMLSEKRGVLNIKQYSIDVGLGDKQ